MQSPVTAADGHSYEQHAIEKWFKTSNISPLTGLPMQTKKLIPSHALRNAIIEHQAASSSAGPSSQLPPQPAVARPSAASRAGTGAPPGGMSGAAALKLILIGDSGVGKTSLVHRVKEGTFSVAPPTIGCSFCTHSVQLSDGGSLPLNIWDTAGQEKYRSFTRQYFRGARAVLVCYDISRLDSFEGAQRWVREVQQEGLSPPPVMALVGSKSDLEDQRQVSKAEAGQFANEQRMLHLECSAKDGTLVDDVFKQVATTMQANGLGTQQLGGLRVAHDNATRASTHSSGGCC